jgi:hypothetical protein
MKFLAERAAMVGGMGCESEDEQGADGSQDSSEPGRREAMGVHDILRFNGLDVAPRVS